MVSNTGRVCLALAILFGLIAIVLSGIYVAMTYGNSNVVPHKEYSLEQSDKEYDKAVDEGCHLSDSYWDDIDVTTARLAKTECKLGFALGAKQGLKTAQEIYGN